MDSEKNSQSDSNPIDSYSVLGVEKGSTYESIKKAKDKRLIEVGDDLIARAKIEAAYDSLLMVSLKARQSGKVSNAAISASKKEELNKQTGAEERSSLLTKLKNFNVPKVESSGSNLFSNLDLPAGDGLKIRVSLGILTLVILLISPPASVASILSFSTIATLISQVRRGRKFFPSFGLSFVLLSLGVLIGVILFGGSQEITINTQFLPRENLMAIPAIVLLWLGTLLLG